MTLADRLNQIISEQQMTKRAFAKRFGISEDYVYLLTGNSKNCPDTMAPTLAKLIALELGYDVNCILYGDANKS